VTAEGHVTALRFDAAGRRGAVLATIHDPQGKPPHDLVPQGEGWGVAKNERLQVIGRGGAWKPTGVALPPDGARGAGAYAHDDASDHRVAVREVGAQKPAFEVTAATRSRPPRCLPPDPFGPDGRTLAVVHDRSVVLHDAVTGRPRWSSGPLDADVKAV